MARIRRSLHTMLLTISNSKPVSTGCLLLTCLNCFLADDHRAAEEPHVHTYISKSEEFSPRSKNSNIKERFYIKRQNLQSYVTKINVREQQQQLYAWQRLKMYEQVGKTFNHQRQRSDESQMTPNHHHDKEQKMKKWTFIKDHKAWRNKEQRLFLNDTKRQSQGISKDLSTWSIIRMTTP